MITQSIVTFKKDLDEDAPSIYVIKKVQAIWILKINLIVAVDF